MMSDAELTDDNSCEVQVRPAGTEIILIRITSFEIENFVFAVKSAISQHGHIFRYEFVSADIEACEMQVKLVPDNGMKKIRITDQQLGN